MKIALTMIVKDEAPVIARCLESCKPHIDAWVIADTGSSDGTQDIIRETMQGIPGELVQHEWKDFATNRNMALAAAYPHGDYLLTIDADEVFQGPKLIRHGLSADAYMLPVTYSGVNYQRCAMISTRLKWAYRGVLHEFLESATPANIKSMKNPTIFVRHEGARARDPSTYLKDIALLEQAVKDEPGNARYAFYLGQSYKDACKFEQARGAYLYRATMPGWNEETFMAKYEAARISERLGYSPKDVAFDYLNAYQFLPTRAESLYCLGRYHRLRNEFALAWVYLQQASAIPMPPSGLFVEASIYEWRIWDEIGIVGYYTGHNYEGKRAAQFALQHAPESEHERMKTNIAFYK